MPFEREVHERIVDLLNAVLLPPAVWAPYPAGVVQLSAQQQAAMSRFGLKRGMPDLMIWHNYTYGIELKRHGGRLSKARIVRTARGSPRVLEGQEEMFPRLLATGAWGDIAICHDTDEVLGCLAAWNIPHRRVANGER